MRMPIFASALRNGIGDDAVEANVFKSSAMAPAIPKHRQSERSVPPMDLV